MSALILAMLLLACFEVAWARVPSLRQHRAHFRGMLAVFWSAAALAVAGSTFESLSSFYFQGVPRFASDALTYHRQAEALADCFREAALYGCADDGLFAYSRLLALLYVVFGTHAVVGSVFNAVFYMASVTAIFYIGRLVFNDRVGLLAAWLCACAPTLLLHDTQTLRWATTTAGMQVAVLGVLLLAGARWRAGLLLAVAGFTVLLNDLPYMALLFITIVALYAMMTLLYGSLGRERVLVAGRLAALVFVMVTLYLSSWATPVVLTEDTRLREVSVRRQVTDTRDVVASVEPRPKRAAPSNPEPPYLAVLTNLIAPALVARVGFLDEMRTLQQSGIPVGTAIEGRELATFVEFARNLPAAIGVAVAEPTIPRLLGDSRGSSGFRRVAAIEMLFYYIVTGAALWGLAYACRAGAQTRILTAFVVLLVAAVYVLLGTTVLNGGTLHRLRQPYVGFLGVYAAAAMIHARGRFGRRVTP